MQALTGAPTRRGADEEGYRTMSTEQNIHQVFGAELSPYSVKVRSYCRYKGIPHEWIVRSSRNEEDFRRHAKLPLVPLVVCPDGQVLQDSTPIIEALEARYPEPSIHPDEPVARFVSELLEEFGDEWGNKWMFHYRWAREADQLSAAARLAAAMMPDVDAPTRETIAASIRERMVGRVWFVGSSPETAARIEQSFADGLALLETHLATQPYLFGGRPAFADFGLWGQIYNAWTDPTPREIIEGAAPHTLAWIRRMLEPSALGAFESWATLEPTLLPLLEQQVGRLFLPWSAANARALAAAEQEFTTPLGGQSWTQKPQKYHARSLAALKIKFKQVRSDATLQRVLQSSDCLRWLHDDA